MGVIREISHDDVNLFTNESKKKKKDHFLVHTVRADPTKFKLHKSARIFKKTCTIDWYVRALPAVILKRYLYI